jgi:phosphohistidine swiveling domain-containing protein
MSGEPPGTGYWTRDRAHFCRPIPAFGLGLVADGTAAKALAAGAARIGVCDSGGDVVVRDGWIFRRSRPLDPSTFADRERAAREFLETRGWEQQLAEWAELRPGLAAACRRAVQVDVGGLTDAQLIDHLEAADEIRREGSRQHFQHHPMCALIGDYVLACRSWGLSDAEALEPLVGSSPASAGVASHLERIAAALRAADVRPDTLDDVSAASAEAKAALDDYLLEYGCRSVAGYGVEYENLEEMTSVVVASIIRALDGRAEPPQEFDTTAIRAKVPSAERARFDEMLDAARSVYGLRDDDGSFASIGRGLLRRTLLEVAIRFVERGQLLAVPEIFDMTPSEVKALLAGGDAPAAEEIHRRFTARQLAAAEEPPTSYGEPGPPEDLSLLPEHTRRLTAGFRAYMAMRGLARDGVELTGTGAGTTAYRGRAVVTSDADEAFDRLAPGDVLVATMTTAAYNAVLTVCGALVVEAAGPLSHAGVMARELGLPAVLGAAGATAAIPDGALVEVDPLRGSVRVLERP